MAHGLSGALEYEDLQGAAPDIEADASSSDSSKLKGSEAYYTAFIPEQAGENVLSIWTSLVEAAWGVREPHASDQERGMWIVLRSLLAHAFFEMSVPAVVAHCQILCKKLGLR